MLKYEPATTIIERIISENLGDIGPEMDSSYTMQSHSYFPKLGFYRIKALQVIRTHKSISNEAIWILTCIAEQSPPPPL